MSLEARSVQFAPFAALVGYEDMVEETARLTDDRIEIDDEVKSSLDGKLQILLEQIQNTPLVTITFFVADQKKKGGKYVRLTGNVNKIDFFQKKIYLTDDTQIGMGEIVEMEGEIFENL